ncbi:TetR/AcrR family transcriptional regulator [Alsobacter sp. R-9]
MQQTASTEESTDARILAAAADHVRRYGYERTTVVSVARDAGMTHANVYRYFPSKLALADALTASWLRPLEADLAGIADAPDPADDKLERLLLAWASALRDRLEQDPNLFEMFVEASSEMRGVARKHRARVRALIERIIEEGTGSGLFDVKRPERAVALLHDALFRFIHPLAVRLDREVPRRTLEDRLAVVVRSVLRTLKTGGA